jgi:hypothetical protein
MSAKISTLKEGILKLQLRQIYLESEIVRRSKLLEVGDKTYSQVGWERQIGVLDEEFSGNQLEKARLEQELVVEAQRQKAWEERDRKYAEMIEVDRILILKRRLLSEFSKVVNLESGECWQGQLGKFLLEKGVEEKVRVNILESVDDATEMLREMETQGKHAPSEVERENIGEILYWARQG